MGERSNLGIAVGIGVIAGFLIAVGNLYWKLGETQTELSNLRSSVQGEITKLSDATHKASRKLRQPILEAFPPWSKPCKTSIPSKPRNGSIR